MAKIRIFLVAKIAHFVLKYENATNFTTCPYIQTDNYNIMDFELINYCNCMNNNESYVISGNLSEKSKKS